MSDPLYPYKCIMHNKGIHANKNENQEFSSDFYLKRGKKLELTVSSKSCWRKKSCDGTMSEGKKKTLKIQFFFLLGHNFS